MSTSTEPETIQQLLRDLTSIPGIGSAHIADTWSDGYRRIRLVIAYSHRSETCFKIRAASAMETWFQIPEYARIIAAVRAVIRKSDVELRALTGLERKVEYLDRVSKGRGEKPLTGYDGIGILIQVYA